MTFIIAEVGSNYTSLDDCLQSIRVAKECGADAVKFQLYSHHEMYGYNGPKMLGEMPREWVATLKAKSDAVGVEFMCTAFSPNGVKFLDPYVKRHKIASAEMSHHSLVTEAIISGKPILMSVGGRREEEIASVLKSFEGGFYSTLTLLYCRSAYPATNINLECIPYLRSKFGLDVGYSCHSPEWVMPYYAAKHYQAKVIEKHFALREMDTPDMPHSILPYEFQQMVESIRTGSLAIMMPDPSEQDMVDYHNRRSINAGYYRLVKPKS